MHGQVYDQGTRRQVQSEERRCNSPLFFLSMFGAFNFHSGVLHSLCEDFFLSSVICRRTSSLRDTTVEALDWTLDACQEINGYEGPG